ncbi:hypothetical protein C8Q76DRAFT_621136 [Earliella scabrosa]|nr:hypothetical protein C8Q76DRAFT_621136 [Earliella scabrosa]
MNNGRVLFLAYPRGQAGGEVEEVILRVQGFLLEAVLPPVRPHHIPRTRARIMDLKQMVTLTGLGAERFDCAVRGAQSIFQTFKATLERRGCQLRDWSPGRDGYHLTLGASNRYLTSMRDAGGEAGLDLAEVVDPFNVLRPLVQTEVHIQENVVQYWQRQGDSETQGRPTFIRIKPDLLSLSNMVEIQVAFIAARTGRTEYVFLPKLRSVCLLDRCVERDYNAAAIRMLSSKPASPLKKVKRKVGYDHSSNEEADAGGSAPQAQLKRLCLEDRENLDRDVRMK